MAKAGPILGVIGGIMLPVSLKGAIAWQMA